jgi:hypothetical protein
MHSNHTTYDQEKNIQVLAIWYETTSNPALKLNAFMEFLSLLFFF